jgi:Amidohydrolase family
MTQFLAVGRLAPLLLVLTFLHFPQEEHLAAKAHDGAGSTTNAGSQAINEQLNPARSAPLVLEHVTVIAGNGSPAIRDAIVFIRDGRIVQVEASNTFVAPPNSQRVDATGKFAIPGLWDMHVHLFNNFTGDGSDNHAYFFPLFVANGIVGVRDMWSDPDDIVVARRWNEETASGRLIGPRVMVSSRVVDGDPPNGPNSLVVHNELEARDAVRGLKSSGAGFIKVYWFLSRSAYLAIADEAKKQRIEFSGHVPVALSAAEASDAGQRTIEHNDGILPGCSAKEAEWLTRDRNSPMPGRGAEMLQAYDDARCEALGRRFAKNGTWLVPTAVNFNDPPDVELDSRRRYVLPAEIQRWTSAMKSRQAARESSAPLVALRRERARQMMQAMRRAGVRFMAGTDLSSRDVDGFRRPFHIPGVGLHDELALFVNSGFTPAEALQTATSNVAQYAGRLQEFGTLETGKRADIVLLDANPLEDIRNTRKIHAVILGGRLFSRSELDDMVDRAVGRAP